MADAIRDAVTDNHAHFLAPGGGMLLAAQGIGIIPGDVMPLTGSSTRGRPMIGWCPLEPVRKDPTIRGVPPGAYVYFRTLDALDVSDASIRVADVRLGAARLPALVRQGNVIGTLFEPEKSGEIGLRFLMNFLRRTSTFSSTRLRLDPRLRRQAEADQAEEADATRSIE